MSVFSTDPATAARNIETAIDTLIRLAAQAETAPGEGMVRAIQDNAYAIIRQARACGREATGIAAHMFCNYIDGLKAAGAWNVEGVTVHAEALRCLWTETATDEADRVLQGLLALSKTHLAASA